VSNQERPHQALDMIDYPQHDWTAVITTCGRMCTSGAKST
jgi:hypothetical protein